MPTLSCLGKRPFDVAMVFGRRATRRHIRAVDREGRYYLFERSAHPVQSKIAGVPILHRQTVKLAGQNAHLARKVDLHDPLLAGVKHLVEMITAISDAAVEPCHRAFTRGIDKQTEDLVGK